MIIKFSAAQNIYVREITGESIKGWASGVKSASNITRKEERDWKMGYLARTGISLKKRHSFLIMFNHYRGI